MSQSDLTPERSTQSTFWSNFNRSNSLLNEMIRIINTKGLAVWLEPPIVPVQNYDQYSSIHSSKPGLALLEKVYHSPTVKRLRDSLREGHQLPREQISRRLRYSITRGLAIPESQHME